MGVVDELQGSSVHRLPLGRSVSVIGLGPWEVSRVRHGRHVARGGASGVL